MWQTPKETFSEFPRDSGAVAIAILKFSKYQLTWVGVSNFVDFIWIQPDLLFAAFHHWGCEPLLQLEGAKIIEKICKNLVQLIKGYVKIFEISSNYVIDLIIAGLCLFISILYWIT